MGESKLPEQQVHDLEGDLSRVDAALDAAERGARWGEVAALRAERDHIAAALDQARAALRAAEEQAAQEQQAREAQAKRAALLARDAALAERWDAWNAEFARLSAEASKLWPEHKSILREYTMLQQEMKAVGGDLHMQTRFTGRLCQPAAEARDGGGFLRWKG